MTIQEFGREENPVLLLLPGTMCFWKGNFGGVIDELAEDFRERDAGGFLPAEAFLSTREGGGRGLLRVS